MIGSHSRIHLAACLIVVAFVGCQPRIATQKTVDEAQQPETTTVLKPVVPDAAADSPAKSSVKVMLGDETLLSGIPGIGPLKVEKLKTWLDDEANHQRLVLQYPRWLVPAGNQVLDLSQQSITRAKIELGRQLFFDQRLSADGTISCATCHDPDHGFTIDKPVAMGVGGVAGKRNPPTLLNRVMLANSKDQQYWDGSKTSLEDALLHSLTDANEMAADREKTLAKLKSIEGYRLQFERSYGEVTWDAMGDAVGIFVHNLVTSDSPYDFDWRWRAFKDADEDDLAEDPAFAKEFLARKTAAEANPMSAAARRGDWLFHGNKAWCSACHNGVNFTDELYHNTGVGLADEEPDLGRFLVTGEYDDWGAFKTPTIRNAQLTGPYMHDGSVKSLTDVVDWYSGEGHPNRNLDYRFKRIEKLTEQDKADLVEFIKACAGSVPKVETGRLPE